jgi:tetratricopeptide (TPR) repeat protein
VIASLLCGLALAIGQGDVAGLFEALDAARGPAQEELCAKLEARGGEAARHALAPAGRAFAELGLEARRARAELLRRVGGPEQIAAALAVLADADERVRASLIAFLGASRLRDASASERAEALRAVALAQPPSRETAIRAVASIDHDSAVAALVELVRATSGDDRTTAARALASHARCRVAVTELAGEALRSNAGALSGEALAVLVAAAYGASLAELPGGGESPADRAAFALGAHHPDERVRRACAAALREFVDRAEALGDAARAERVLEALAASGLDDPELRVRQVELALDRENGAERALELARAIVERHPLSADAAARTRRASGDLLAAAALIAQRRTGECEPFLSDAQAVLAALRGERTDLRPGSRTPTLGTQEIEERLMEALVPTYRALAALVDGKEPGSLAVLERARDADELLLQAHLWVARSVYGLNPSHDELFQHPLGPTTLLFGRSRAASFGERQLELERGLYRAFGTVTAGGLPGFEPLDVQLERLKGPLTDPPRRHLLERIQSAQHESALREIDRRIERAEQTAQGADPMDLLELSYLRRRMEMVFEDERREGAAALVRRRGLSNAGLAFAERLREHGQPQSARRTAERVAADLESARGSLDDLGLARRLAAADSALGGALMDLDEPAEAQRAFERGLERLEGAAKELERGEDGAAKRSVRSQTAGMLTSLAVNANVKQRRPAEALEYFERAYELDQSDFMRVLLACYRARAGRTEEARAALADVPVSPNNFYNLACTYALLGEPQLALDFLRRDLGELRASRGARARQKRWAQDDPDLAALKGDPRFDALVRLEPGELEEK